MTATAISSSRKPASFETEAFAYLDEVYRTAYAILQNRSEAENVVQNTFVKAGRSFSGAIAGANCRVWLFRLLFDEISRNRQTWNRRVSAEETAVEGLLDQLCDLPHRCAFAVLLCDVHEFTYKEIGQVLRATVDEVIRWLTEGRKLLRERMLLQVSHRAG